MVKIKFPDGNVKEFESGVTGMDIAKSISHKLAKEVLSISVNGVTWDLMRGITTDSEIKLYTWDDEEGRHAFWHSSAHLMAEALQAIYPNIKFGIGPAIENGFYYDVDPGEGVAIQEKDLVEIEKKMLELARKNEEYCRIDVSKQEALNHFSSLNETYKVELINDLEDGTITYYRQGDFTDLCRGPHLPNTSYIKAIKLTSVAGAYWRGNEHNKMLTRIYGITFPKQKMLDEWLVLMEEAKQRDHRKIGKEMELFMFSQAVGSGLPMWLPKGAMLRDRLEAFLRKVQKKYGYEQVITPHIGNVNLYKTSGHFQKYGKDSFQVITTPQEGEEFMLKPMNCPHHCEMYKFKPRSYKDLPVRFAEFGTVYRYEQSGELHGLTRVRGFTQDDAHLFCTPDQLKEEFKKVIDIIFTIFKALSFENFTAQVSLRDPNNKEKYIGTDENWEKAESAIIEAAAEKGLKTTVELGEAAFYGPKLDFMVKDAIGRKWQLGTIQVDYNLPERFELEYTGADNQKHRPVMIHRAPFGSMERFVAVLIEHTGGKFPLWLTPDQVVVLPISEKYNDYAQKVVNFLNNSDIRTVLDDRNEKIGRKIRDNELKKIPYMLIVGEQEMNENKVSVRRQGEGDKGSMTTEEFAEMINKEVEAQLNSIYNE
ncbi:MULTISPECIES: threonine--tRNA ligase [Butyricimonas]|jgi:threonyl-tRNA synthetase|uniref:Threonine--tRNA ligase n=3 Tax=Butyricimonas TaxID=574697 RepID=A0A921KX19_9BACT|nr:MULTISPECIES: threonine--tRNA ligase [Butyricimonas]MBS5625207.1 threonine--tRNA ligase [Porphyromonadaceae bacterium]MBS6687960.1 threonine--tRNA ligase [Sanguibacteroides justesenii]OKZ15706.1 MAG: threonine--tRNA ligase [Butyricimonas synergistica]KAB1506650.1 threonine--tRNA ligase [Butyricimonas faecihominis]MBB4025920.1 threonyl-tRNA synthetase [Butyricimonas faecihominis]